MAKHNLKITLILLGLFLLTQIVGLFIVNSYFNTNLPFGLETPQSPVNSILPWDIIFAFILAFLIIFALIKYKWKIVMQIWFLLVVALALGITLNSVLRNTIPYPQTIALIIAIPLALLKMFRPNAIIHHATEVLIYPGIAAVFVPILTPTSIIVLLIIISIYDMWAVWKSGIMQKMAKFQINELKILGGFLIPKISKKDKEKIKQIKQKYKGKKIPEKIKKQKFKVNIAILGGGDVIFPIITAGVFLKFYGLIPAIFVILGALAGLSSIFFFSKKRKDYPAMPYITTGIFIALLIWRLFIF